MEMNWSDLLIGLFSGIGGVIIAMIGKKGSKEQATITFSGDLLQRQGERIATLEARLDSVEQRLSERDAELLVEKEKVHILNRGLRDAVEWLRDFVDWERGGCVGNPPQPDIAELMGILNETLPNARNPPTEG